MYDCFRPGYGTRRSTASGLAIAPLRWVSAVLGYGLSRRIRSAFACPAFSLSAGASGAVRMNSAAYTLALQGSETAAEPESS